MALAKFEHLPDEILLNICLYLKPLEVIDALGQLNERLDRTISQYRRHFDIHHLTLKQYRYWSSHLLPYTAKDIVQLVLSNWNSPGQIRLFNQSIQHLTTLQELFPQLKQLRLIGFDNDNVDILPKLMFIEKIFIDIDALKPLFYSTECLLDRYLFCSAFSFKEIRLWTGENGIRLRHQTNLIFNRSLEQLTIVLTRFDDLILLFQRAPNLLKLYVQINAVISNRPIQFINSEMMPKYLTDFHIQTNDRRALIFDHFFILMIHLPSLEHLSLDIDTNDMDYADGLCWTLLKSRLPHLKQLDFRIRLWIGTGLSIIDSHPFLQSFLHMNIPVACYSDTRVLHIDTIPYERYKFETHTCLTMAPCVRRVEATDHDLFHRPIYGIQSLFISGRYEPTQIDDWLIVLRKFPTIRALDLTAVNIIKSDTLDKDIDQRSTLRLPRLIALRWVRSRRGEIHIPLFLTLVQDETVAPRLRALTVMYGDLVHLCRRLPDCTFDRIEELWLFNSDTDGRIISEDMRLMLHAFRSLRHFTFFMHSSRAISRHAETIITLILSSLPHLISFRMLCRKGSFHLHSLTLIRRILAMDDDEPIHFTIDNKEISIWK